MTARGFRISSAAAIALTGALVLTACGGGNSADDTDGGAAGEGVAFGASMEEYHEAFADIEPMTLRMQVDSAAGSGIQNAGRERYAAALEEWSDGKITVEIGYANAFVPNAAEWASAYGDGRLDFGWAIPSYTPDIFPVNNSMSDASFLGDSRPVSSLIAAAWMTEVSMADPKYLEEYESEGIHVLIPAMPAHNPTGLFCTNPYSSLSELNGKQVSVSGIGKTAQVQSLGMGPVSMPYTEQYEALERGVIDCAATSPTAVQAGGLAPLTPHVVLDPEVAMTFPSLAFVAGASWEDLPLVAQQLIFDRLDVLLSETVLVEAERVMQVIEDLETNGGGIIEFSDDARTAVQTENERLLGDIAETGADVDLFQERAAAWADIILDEFGYYDGSSYAEFIAQVDPEPYTTRIIEEVLLPFRPE